MPRRSPGTVRVKGDVNVKNGDVVAGDKKIAHQEHGSSVHPKTASARKPVRSIRKNQVIDGNLEVQNGDVVFGDKVIQFFQKRLRIYLFKDIKQLAFFLAVVITVSGGIAGGIWYANQPKRMNGDFNIAVARFGEIQADGTVKPSARAEKISSTLFSFLDSEYQATSLGLKVQTAHRNMPLVLEDLQAQALANKVHADIVIYGNVYIGQEQAEFSPRFYVAEKPDTRELTGQNELASSIAFNVAQLEMDSHVNSQLRARTEILFNFTKALIYFSQQDADAALRAAKTAIAAAEKLPKPFAGEEVVYLLAAKIQMYQKDYDGANQMLDRALALNKDYARAHLARGNIFYIQALDSNFDSQLLDQAKSEYELAYKAVDQPEGAYIPIKSHSALGNIYVVMAQQANDAELFTKAMENYGYVVDEYQRTKDPFIQSYASIAYFGLGAAHERQGDKVQAIQAYQRAYDLTTDEEFKTRISNQIKSIQTQ